MIKGIKKRKKKRGEKNSKMYSYLMWNVDFFFVQNKISDIRHQLLLFFFLKKKIHPKALCIQVCSFAANESLSIGQLYYFYGTTVISNGHFDKIYFTEAGSYSKKINRLAMQIQKKNLRSCVCTKHFIT
jgi:hypothetical protein